MEEDERVYSIFMEYEVGYRSKEEGERRLEKVLRDALMPSELNLLHEGKSYGRKWMDTL